jgi:hypothetical protein
MARRKRRSRSPFRLPELTVKQILAWVDAYHERSGKWPKKESGHITGSFGETWSRVHSALQKGYRGLPGGSSLARLLHEHRGVRNHMALPRLTPAQILTWADIHQRRAGSWPRRDSGPVAGAPGETWSGINTALSRGLRHLPGGSTLADLLAAERGHRNRKNLPRLRRRQILAWAEAHHNRTGRWPNHKSGPIAEAPGETWLAVESALDKGLRGQPGGDSLARLLARRLGARNRSSLPRLTVAQILRWADAHWRRTGQWSVQKSGPISDAEGETWLGVHQALYVGCRGLPGGDTLVALLARCRGRRNRAALPRLSDSQILEWARAHRRRTDQWPSVNSGPILDAEGEIWANIDQALRKGLRGLPGGSSVARLLTSFRQPE